MRVEKGGGRVPGQCSRICVAVDYADMRRRIHRALLGVAHEMLDVDGIAEAGAVRRAGDERLLIIVGCGAGGIDLTPAALARVRALLPLVPIIVCLPPRHMLLRRLGGSRCRRSGSCRYA